MTHTGLLFFERLTRVLLLSALVRSQLHSTHSYCILEGAPFQTLCSGTTHSKNRIIIWMRANNNRHDSSKELAECYPGFTKCHVMSGKSFKVTAHQNGTSFKSLLLVPKASLELDGAVFTCKVYDFSKTVSVSTCRLRVYKPPKNASCRVTFVDGEGRVSITCAVRDIHPNIFCSIPHDETSRYSFLNKTQVTYSKHCEHHPKRNPRRSDSCTHTCVLKVQVHMNGTYQFKIRIYAQVGHEVQNETYIEKLTDRVMVRHLPSAKILSQVPSDLDVCPDLAVEQRKPQVFTCQGTWLTSDPEFVWRVHYENSMTHPSNDKIVKTDFITLGNRTAAESKLEFLPLEQSPSHVRYISCELRLKDDADLAINVPASRLAQSPVGLRWPPRHPPIWTSSKGYVLKERLWILRGNNETLRCNIKGGQPSVNFTAISCWTADGQNETLPHISNPGSVAELVVFGEPRLNRASCMCSAQHITGCYHLTSTFDVRVLKINPPAVLEPQEEHATLKWRIFIYVAGSFIILCGISFMFVKVYILVAKPKRRLKQIFHRISDSNSKPLPMEPHDFSEERLELPVQVFETRSFLEQHENHVTNNRSDWHPTSTDYTENPYSEIPDIHETMETSFLTSMKTTEAYKENQHMGKTGVMVHGVESNDYITPLEVSEDGYESPIAAQSN